MSLNHFYTQGWSVAIMQLIHISYVNSDHVIMMIKMTKTWFLCVSLSLLLWCHILCFHCSKNPLHAHFFFFFFLFFTKEWKKCLYWTHIHQVASDIPLNDLLRQPLSVCLKMHKACSYLNAPYCPFCWKHSQLDDVHIFMCTRINPPAITRKEQAAKQTYCNYQQRKIQLYTINLKNKVPCDCRWKKNCLPLSNNVWVSRALRQQLD